MIEKIIEIVEEHIAKAAADDNAKRGMNQQIVETIRQRAALTAMRRASHQPPTSPAI